MTTTCGAAYIIVTIQQSSHTYTHTSENTDASTTPPVANLSSYYASPNRGYKVSLNAMFIRMHICTAIAN